MRPKIQVALDLVKLEKAVDIASRVAEYVDYIEAGTPLIKVEGMKSVSLLKRKFPSKKIIADLKTMDTGYLEASLAYEHGADYSTVMGVADINTIKGAIKARDEFSKGMMIDLMNLDDSDKIRYIASLKPDYFIIHSGIDMQLRGIEPFENLHRILNMDLSIKIGVAGGLNNRNLLNLKGLDVDLLIVGGYITKAVDPVKAAKQISETLEEIF